MSCTIEAFTSPQATVPHTYIAFLCGHTRDFHLTNGNPQYRFFTLHLARCYGSMHLRALSSQYRQDANSCLLLLTTVYVHFFSRFFLDTTGDSVLQEFAVCLYWDDNERTQVDDGISRHRNTSIRRAHANEVCLVIVYWLGHAHEWAMLSILNGVS